MFCIWNCPFHERILFVKLKRDWSLFVIFTFSRLLDTFPYRIFNWSLLHFYLWCVDMVTYLYPTQRSCVSIMFLNRQSVRPCVIICYPLDSTFICWSIYTKLWEIVSNSKSMDGIDFQKNHNLGRGLSYICVIICCRLVSAYICRSIYMKLWEVISNSKGMYEIDCQKNLQRGSLFWEGHLVKFLS
jgi:hypothetical protein